MKNSVEPVTPTAQASDVGLLSLLLYLKRFPDVLGYTEVPHNMMTSDSHNDDVTCLQCHVFRMD